MFYGVVASRRMGGGQRISRDLARVNGKNIDPARFQEIMGRILRQFGENIQPQDMAFVQNLALNQTIDFTLILAEARRKVRVTNREVDMTIDNIIQQQKLGSKKDLDRILKRSGSSLRQFKKMIKDEMLVQKMINKIRSEAQVTPDDLREVRASHILVSDEAAAEDILARVKKGENFSALAKKYSQDPGSASKGGDLDYITTGMTADPFEKAAFSLKPGELSEVVKTDFGYHIIKVTDSRLRRFSGEEKDIDKAALADKQDKAFKKWYSKIRSKAKVEIVNPALKANDLRFKGRIWEAITEYNKAIKADPANPYLHVFLGDVYNTIGKSDMAIKEYQAAAAIEGGNPVLYLILAGAYEKSGEKDKAVKEYKRASLVAGDNKALHEQLLAKFKELKAWTEYNREKKEIARIEKKEKFEAELKGTD
jgi:foldase protein PrsA